jgi:hypothetical protein
MLALVAAGGRGDDSPPVFFTVPWSPMIGERGELPGELLHRLLALVPMARAIGPRLREPDVFRRVLIERGSLVTALGITLAYRLLIDMGQLAGSAS